MPPLFDFTKLQTPPKGTYYNEPIGFICLNNADLVRDGFIHTSIQKEHEPDDFDFTKLQTPPKGTYYIVERDVDTGKPTKVIEKRRQLPASKVKVEIAFSKQMENAITNPITPGFLTGFGGIGGGSIYTVGSGIAPMGLSGLVDGITEFTWHLCDAETKINIPIEVTEKIKYTGVIEFENEFPLSVFGVVKEHIEEVEEEQEVDGVTQTVTTEVKYGLNFTAEQLQFLGRFFAGNYEGTPRRDIRGASDVNGLFGGYYRPQVEIDDILFEDQENLFIEIGRYKFSGEKYTLTADEDTRRYKFRADNQDASGESWYPFSSPSEDDITKNAIRIKTDPIAVGDTIYLTYSIASQRRVRQSARHYGQVWQDNSYSILTQFAQSPIASKVQAFDYQIREWYVPDYLPLPEDKDSKYKLNINQYITVKNFLLLSPEEQKKQEEAGVNPPFDKIEGWRFSESISERREYIWTADYRGILLNKGNSSTVILLAQEINDQEWFTKYLESLPFTTPTGVDGEYLYSDLQEKFEDHIKADNLDKDNQTMLFDIGEANNSLIFDREKIGYYRPFALALKEIGKYDPDALVSGFGGIGIPHLDIFLKYILDNYNLEITDFDQISLNVPQAKNYFYNLLKFFDLSFAVFKSTQGRSRMKDSCEGDFALYTGFYPCAIYDPSSGPGTYFTESYIENQFMEWRPPGGYVESYWKLDTPYYCGEFNRKSRVYTEHVGGNSPNNYSMIYAHAVPAFPYTISLDNDYLTDKAILTFREDYLHFCTSYLQLTDGEFESDLDYVTVDREKSHLPEPFEHDKFIYMGYNKILGERPSYSHGSPVSNEVSEICHLMDLSPEWIPDFWQVLDFLQPDYGLDMTDNPPSITLTEGKYLQDLYIEYTFNGEESVPSGGIPEKEREISLYFKEHEAVINNIRIPFLYNELNKTKIECKFYRGNPLQLTGSFWKYIEFDKIYGIVVDNRLESYKIDAGQTAVIYDRVGRILIFYHDQDSGNISVATSYNDGHTWNKQTDIIRLIEGETASLPFVISDEGGHRIYLFYVLNDTFIMFREVNTDWFSKPDLWVDYVPPAFYDETSEDDDDDNALSSLYNYTELGKRVRREISYFAVGDAEDAYFKKQIEIKDKIEKNNVDNNKEQSIRFDLASNPSEMIAPYNGNAYSVYEDNSGFKRLFFINSNKLSIKGSPDFRKWDYIAKDVIIHKNFFNEVLGEGETLEVKNIQLIRNYHDSDFISVLYFHNGMLFFRYFRSNILNRVIKDDTFDDTEIRKELEVTKENDNQPLFLVGNLTDEIKKGYKEKLILLQNGQPDTTELAIKFAYDADMIDRFDERFSLDTDTQTFGYTAREGLIRVFYKDALFKLQGLVISGFTDPTPQVLFELKE